MRLDRFLAGSALALVLTASVAAHAGFDGRQEAAVPAIEPATVQISPADVDLSTPVAPRVEALAAPGREAEESLAIPPRTPPEGRTGTGTGGPAAPARAKNAERPVRASIEPVAGDRARALNPVIPLIEPAPVVITPADLAVTANADPSATGSITVPATPLTAVPEAKSPEAAPVTPLDPVGEALRAKLAGKDAERLFDRKTREGLSAYYSQRNHTLLWSDNGVMNERAKAVAAQLRAADADGLDPADYPVPKLEANAGPDALADFELKLTDAAFTYARHAAVGRVHWSRVARDVVYTATPPEPSEALGKLATAADAGAALDSYNPQHPAYKALKAKLAEARGGKVSGPARIGAGPTLKIGMKDDRVPELRERLGIAGESADTTYDDTLADAVKAFQKEKKLAANGHLTAATIDALNGKVSDHRGERAVDVILANLERWRWLPHELGDAHVIVNIPEFMLRVYKDGKVLWSTRIVVGKPSTPTPLLTETMKFITVNPTWNVPPSIVYGEYLPALRQDPTVLARMGLRVSYNRDGGVHISQPPGASNALGRIRFNFPNKFLVYQHDTPDKHMFAHDKRAYSHGCMRVQDPDKYAEVLLSIALPKENYTAARIRGMYGSGEVNINFPEPIPVHLTYQTAFVDAGGKLVLRDDVYGRDQRVIASLKTEERRVADTPAAEPRSASSGYPRRQAYRSPYPQPRYNGFSFFGLFR